MIQNIIIIISIIFLIYVFVKAGLIQKAGNHVVDITAKAIANVTIFIIVLLFLGLISKLFIK